MCAKLLDNAGNTIFDEMSPPYYRHRYRCTCIDNCFFAADLVDGHINATENGNATAIVSHDGSGGDTVEYKMIASTDTCADAPAVTAVPAANSQTTQGDYKICVRVSDTLNPEQIVESSTFTIDTTAPTIDAGASLVRNSAATLSPSLGDATSLIWSEAELTFGNVNLAGSTVAANADDPYAILLTAYGTAGNSSTDTLVLTWDTTAPIVNVGADFTIGSMVTLNPSVVVVLRAAMEKQSGTDNITFGTANAEYDYFR